MKSLEVRGEKKRKGRRLKRKGCRSFVSARRPSVRPFPLYALGTCTTLLAYNHTAPELAPLRPRHRPPCDVARASITRIRWSKPNMVFPYQIIASFPCANTEGGH